MILQICASEITEYQFKVYNTVSDQTYADNGVDYTTFTNGVLTFKKVNDTSSVSINLTYTELQYLFATGGLTIDFADFGEDTINGFAYFPDWMYTISIAYDYNGTTYTASASVGFKVIITRTIGQQMLQSNWKKELACNCGCDSYSSTLRKFNYLMMMGWDADYCLINDYLTNLQALYKLAGLTHEFV